MSNGELLGSGLQLFAQQTFAQLVFAQQDGWDAAARWGLVAGVLAILALLFGSFGPRRFRVPGWIIGVMGLAAALLCFAASADARALSSGWLTTIWQFAGPYVDRPAAWGVLLCSIGLYLLLPRSSAFGRAAGTVLGVIGLGCFVAALPLSLGTGSRIIFWTLAIVTVVSAAATVSMRNAVYAAIWFAMSLLGTAALYWFQGAQFLGVATVVVYAGAIVVTFLFVIMLAQPKGQAIYDRITWGRLPKISSVILAGLLVAVLTFAVLRSPPAAVRWQVVRALPSVVSASGTPVLRDDQLIRVVQQVGNGQPATLLLVLRMDEESIAVIRSDVERQLPAALANTAPDLAGSRILLTPLPSHDDLLHQNHMARFGRELFSRHLVSVELAGTVLLAALVGAVAIVSHGQRGRQEDQEDERLS